MKKLLAIILAALVAASASAAPLDFIQSGTIDASAYTEGATAVKTIRVLSISYETGVCRFQLLDANGAVYGGRVFGLNDPALNESNVEAKILAAISPS